MSLSEHLFGWARRAWRGKVVVPEHAATFAPLQARLAALARLLGGAQVEVREAEAGGGFGGGTLWLPATLAVTQDRTGNELAYVYRVAYGVTALTHPALRACGDPERDTLASLLAVPTVTAQLHEALPGAATLARCLVPAIVDSSIGRSQDTRARATQALLRSLVGLAAEPGDAVVTGWVSDVIDAARAGRYGQARDDLLAAFRRLPGRGSLAATPLWLWGRPLPVAGSVGVGAVGDPAALTTGSERQGKVRESIAQLQPEPDKGDSPLVHVFEKLITAEEYQGGSKALDGADEMAQHGEALDELDLRHVVRTRERAGSLLRADVAFAAGGFDLTEAAPSADALRYDEWDERQRGYRRGWCAVRVTQPRRGDAAAERAATVARGRLRREIEALRAQLMRLDRSRAPCPRQRDGDEIDIDAVVDHQASLAGARCGKGRVDEGRLHVARRRRVHDVAVLLLIDGSLSTDAWIDGRRVLDVARDAVLVAGEAFADLAIRIAVAAFHSNTRRDCEFAMLKRFDEPWRSARGRLFALTPTGYTRIGPALRHGARWLAQSGARRRLMVLLSDGKPMDYDRYEGRYGMADVRQAVREMAPLGVQPIALAIDPHSKRHLPAMFAPGSFAILPSPRYLPLRLAKILQTVR